MAQVPRLAPRPVRPQRPVTCAEAFKRVPSDEAFTLVESGLPYMDVRTPEEYAAGHPVSAVNIPFWLKAPDGNMVPNPDFLRQVKERFPDAGEQIVVGCRSGNRSFKACTMLEEGLRYSNLIEDTGGWLGWVDQKLPVQT